MQAIGVINVLMASAGFCYSLFFVFRPGLTNGQSLTKGEWLVFLTSAGVAFGLMAAVAYVGFRLLQRDRTAVNTACLLFAIELGYFLAELIAPAVCGASIPLRVMLFFSQAPLSSQELTLYPLWGLFVCLWLRVPTRRGTQSIAVQ